MSLANSLKFSLQQSNFGLVCLHCLWYCCHVIDWMNNFVLLVSMLCSVSRLFCQNQTMLCSTTSMRCQSKYVLHRFVNIASVPRCCWMEHPAYKNASMQSSEVLAWLCLKQGADCLHVVQPTLLPSQNTIMSCLIKIQNGLLFWYWLTEVVLEKRLTRCW